MFEIYRKSIFPLILIFGFAILLYSREAEISTIVTNDPSVHNYAIYTKDGDILYADKINSTKKILRNTVVLKIDDATIINPIGIIENPPEKSIMDIANMALTSLEKDRKVLIIYIDGLGFELYEKALKLNIVPYLSSLNKGVNAITTFPPITDVTFASMVTGVTPKHTGIHNRDKKPMPVPTIFEIAAQMGKTSKLIEGDMRILIGDFETILNIDENNDGYIDDEIYRCALEEMKNPPDLLLVHFHSYDDMAHLHGPNSDIVLNQLSVLDGYTADIVKNYKGDIIITSDHGMHDEGSGGHHGIFCAEDIFIPVIKATTGRPYGAEEFLGEKDS